MLTVPGREARSKPRPIVVRLPDIPSVPDPWKGVNYVIRRLLSHGDDNPKLRKSNAAGPYQTWGLALAPARESGRQMCSSSSAGCRAACLFRQGHARMDSTITACRIAKSVAWNEQRDWFKERLAYEMTTITLRNELVAVRLNLTSDVMWERDWPDLFDQFPEVQFYDYSKHFSRMMRFLNGRLPPNYSLTFSRSERNDEQARAVLGAGGRVAIVFRDRLPSEWEGYAVINGDETDLRSSTRPPQSWASQPRAAARPTPPDSLSMRHPAVTPLPCCRPCLI